MHRTRIFAAGVFVAVGLIAAAPSSYAAGGGYGSGGSPTDVPGGYTVVVATHTFSSDGGSLVANIPCGHALLTVPRGAFVGPLQIAVTTPDLAGIKAALPKLGFPKDRVVAAIGIAVNDTNGHKFTGSFAHSLTLTITCTGVGVGDRVIQFTGASTATSVAAKVSPGSVTVSMRTDPDFAVLAPASLAVAAPVLSPAASSPAASSPTASSPSATSQTGAGVLTSSGPPTQVLGEAFTRADRGFSIVTTALIVAAVAIFAALIMAVRRRSSEPQVAYAGKHGPKRSAYAKRHGSRLVTHAPRH